MVTTDDIKALRNQTGISVMQCKSALEEAGGDAEKALVILRKKGASAALKKSERQLGAGAVAAYMHATGDIGAMVLLSSETDFVSKNEEFKQLAYDIAMHIAATNPKHLSRDDVTEKEQEAAVAVFAKEVTDKPKDMQDKIVEGKLDAYFKESVLLEQPFIKDESVNIRDLVESAIQKFGEKIEITRFARLSTRD